MDKKEYIGGQKNARFKKQEMLDDNGKVPEVLNEFKKLKIRVDLDKDITNTQNKVLHEID